jgi:ketosteroid isomerase-like protein
MKRVHAFLAAAVWLSAASMVFGGQNAEAELRRTDTEFSEYAQAHGIAEAFVRYADAGATMMPAGQNPVTGTEAIRAQFADLPAGATLVWKPFRAEASASGDLGYTLGTYEFRFPDKEGKPAVRHGKYCSVWKKQKDGSWKWVVDIGNGSPAPE